jgi:uncharacterized membrane protein YeiH
VPASPAAALGELLHWLDLFGVVVFAASGALEAARKQLDIVGFLFVAAVTGIGGGTLRDVLLDRPVSWLHEPVYLWLTSGAALLTFLIAPHLQRRATPLLWADAVGLAVFSVLGAQTALDAGTGPAVAVLLGGMTATFGGLIRDVVCTETPLILKREVYATAAAAGATALVAGEALGLARPVSAVAGLAIAIAIRAVGPVYGLSLPIYRPRPARPR